MLSIRGGSGLKLLWKLVIPLVTAGIITPAFGAVITLQPGGTISGLAGSAIGWGYGLTNDTPYYLLPTGSSFFEFTPIGGTYTDFISNLQPSGLLPVIAPGITQQEDFDRTTGGLGSYFMPPGITSPPFSYGIIVVTFDLYSRDPNGSGFDPGQDFQGGGELLADAEVQFIPEPASGFLMVLPLALFGCARIWKTRMTP